MVYGRCEMQAARYEMWRDMHHATWAMDHGSGLICKCRRTCIAAWPTLQRLPSLAAASTCTPVLGHSHSVARRRPVDTMTASCISHLVQSETCNFGILELF